MRFYWFVLALCACLCLALTQALQLNRVKRIVNGNIASPKQFPYQVLLSFKKSRPGSIECGGVIIDESWILTAAHCLDKESVVGVNIYFGRIHINEDDIGSQHLYVNKRYFIIHEDYSSASVVNDVALIRLPVPLQFDDYIQRVNLPNKTDDYAGRLAITTGWGQTDEYDNDSGSDVLRFVTIPIFSNQDCKRKCDDSNGICHDFFTPSNLCVNITGQRGPSFGDSGGPLVLKDEESVKTVVGLVSFGNNFALEMPEIYIRVSYYVDWIKRHMKRYVY